MKMRTIYLFSLSLVITFIFSGSVLNRVGNP